jgi:hypothetical protein
MTRKHISALLSGFSVVSMLLAALQLGQQTANAQSAASIQTVFVIVMENQNWNSSVAGTFTSSNAPYIMNTIVPAAAYANNYTMVSGNQGPSEPNYKWLEAGSDFNQFTDNDPSTSNSISSTQHLATYLNNAGISWTAYAENIDGLECPLVSNLNSLSSTTTIGGGSANYYAKHVPFVFFDDLTNSLSPTSAICINHIRPYSQLATDLAHGTVARYNFIIPNGTDSMHDATVTTGDTWLSQNVPTILTSGAYQNNGAIFVMWDESATDGGTLPFFVLSPLVASAGYSNSIRYSHSSTLLTLQEIFRVGPCLGDACNATDLADLFQAGVISPLSSITVAISPTSATLTASQQQQFKATVTGSANTSVNWTISPSNVGNISVSGLYMAPATISTAQTVAVTATSQADHTAFGTAVIALQPTKGTQSQTITFAALSSRVFGTAPFAVTATSSSGLAVSFASLTPSVCAVSGATVTLVTAGTCTIQATQAGDSTYAAAIPVNQSFQVTLASQTITFGALSNKALGTSPFIVSATASSGLAVSFASMTPSVCTVSGATVTVLALGTCTIQASQAGDASYSAATPINQSFQVTSTQTGTNVVVYLTSGTSYVVPSNWNNLNNSIEVIGGGGGGSYAPSTTISGSAGGGGAYSKATNVTLTPGATVSYRVGAGGVGGTGAQSSGGTGGDTYLCNSTTNCASINGSAVAAGAKGGAGGPVTGGPAAGGAASSGYPSTGIRYSGGASGAGNIGPNPDGGPGGGGAAGPNGPGGAGGAVVSGTHAGGGGGGNGNGGTGALPSVSTNTGGAGGMNNLGSGSGASGTGSAGGGNGSAGGGGGGAGGVSPYGGNGGNGSTGTEWDATHGSGSAGGGGAGGASKGAGGACGLYGGGGGGDGDDYTGTGTPGCQGIIVLTYSTQGTQTQTITFGALSNQPFGTAPFAVSATASSGLAVSFASTTLSVCTVSGITVTLLAVGTCTIQATQAGNSSYSAATPVNQTFQVTQASQTISFGALSDQVFGTAPLTVSATSSSGLPVSFASITPSVCTVSGITVALLTVGTCTVQASQTGNANYAAATPVNQSFQVTQANQTISFSALSNIALGTAPFTVSATASSGLAVSFAAITPSVCTASGATVTLVALGTCTIQATQEGNSTYAPATPVNQSFQVTQTSQTITFGALSNEVFGTAPFTVSATSSSGLAVSFASLTSSVCTVSGDTVTLVAAGTCTIQATQAGNSTYAAATPVNQSFQVTQTSQTITFGALSNEVFGTAPFTVSATSSSGLTVSFASLTSAVCTLSGATVTLVAVGTCTIQATQTGNSNYSAAAPVNQSFQVTQTSQTITFGALSNEPFGTAPLTVSATSSSGLTVSFASLTSAVCTVSGATVTLVAAGTCTIQSTQAGNSNYSAAESVNQSFQVTQTNQTIAFGPLSNKVLGTAPFTLSASASSGLAVGFASLTSSVCTVSGATVTLVAAGTCTIQATQAGNSNYSAAAPVNQSLQVTQASQKITFGPLSNKVFGTAPFTVSASASSGLAVSFASLTSSVCTVSGATVTLVAPGTCTIQATQAGNANYSAATPVNQSFQVTGKQHK